jgi:phosphoribosylaminoimidazole-succinocarboxamide synthase
MTGLDGLTLRYTGSVKNVWKLASKPQHLWFEFTDDYSVFDWGKMPDQIANKGKALALIGTHFFNLFSYPEYWRTLPQSQHLKKFDTAFLDRVWHSQTFAGKNGLRVAGLPSHFLELVGPDLVPIKITPQTLRDIDRVPKLLMEVLAAEVHHPIQKVVADQTVYFYPQANNELGQSGISRRLVPLEVIFRFGMTKGSSLISRLELDPGYAHTLGLSEKPVADQWFSRPVIEFSTKLEPKDRMLTVQEAILMSSLTPDQFERLVDTTLLVALGLHHWFQEKDLELWDGKLEFVIESALDQSLLLADTIGPDELRIMHKGQQLSKEFIRQYYRTTPWSESVKKAQDKAKSLPGADWKEICLQSKDNQPSRLPSNIKGLADNLYGVLANTITGKEFIPDQPTLSAFVSAIDKTLAEGARK